MTITAFGDISVGPGAITTSSTAFQTNPSYYTGVGGPVVLTAGGQITVGGSISASASTTIWPSPYYLAGAGGSVTLIAGTHVLITQPVESQNFSAIGPPVPPSTLNITAGGNVTIAHNLDFSSLWEYGRGGAIAIAAGGNLVLMTGTISAAGGDYPGQNGPVGSASLSGSQGIILHGSIVLPGGYLPMTSAFGSVTLFGGISLHRAVSGPSQTTINQSGTLEVTAHGDITLSTYLDLSGIFGGHLYLTSDRDVILTPSAHVNGNTFFSSYDGGGSGVRVGLRGCRVTVQPGATLVATINPTYYSYYYSEIVMTAGDLLTMGGAITTNSLAPVFTTRLASASITGTISSGPVVPIVDPTLAPCLASDLATLTAPATVSLGGGLTVSATGPPSRPLIVAVDTQITHLSLGGLLGWTQVSFLNPTHFFLADLGAFGSPIAGSTTDGNGAWSYSTTIPNVPSLHGLDVFIEAYILDASARNGVFHQPPYKSVHLN